MSIHSYHPDSHTHGLADGCMRCEEHGRHPFESLDDDNLRELTRRVLEDDEARSDNERAAMDEISWVIRRYERLRRIGALGS